MFDERRCTTYKLCDYDAFMSTAMTRYNHLEPQKVRARAQLLARADRELKADLVKVRRSAGLTQKDVAEILGVTQQAVQKLEHYDSDPKMSTLSRYSNAIGAIVEHKATMDVGQSIWKAAGPRASAPLPRGRVTVPAPGATAAQVQGWSVSGRASFGLAA